MGAVREVGSRGGDAPRVWRKTGTVVALDAEDVGSERGTRFGAVAERARNKVWRKIR